MSDESGTYKTVKASFWLVLYTTSLTLARAVDTLALSDSIWASHCPF